MEKHEFWLINYPTFGENREVYRIALGRLIKAEDRETFKPGCKSPDLENKSGSIGFMDLRVMEKYILKEVANDRDYENYETKKVLIILAIGIEPSHRGRGYARELEKRAEEIALEWGLDTIVADSIENPIMESFMVRLGYQLYDNGFRAVKRLKPKS